MKHIEWETFLPADITAKLKEDDKYFALFSMAMWMRTEDEDDKYSACAN